MTIKIDNKDYTLDEVIKECGGSLMNKDCKNCKFGRKEAQGMTWCRVLDILGRNKGLSPNNFKSGKEYKKAIVRSKLEQL